MSSILSQKYLAPANAAMFTDFPRRAEAGSLPRGDD